MPRQAELESRTLKLHKHAGDVIKVLDRARERLSDPDDLDALHEGLKRGELRRVLNLCESIRAEVETPIEPEILTDEQTARRAAKATKRKAKKKTTKKKTGG